MRVLQHVSGYNKTIIREPQQVLSSVQCEYMELVETLLVLMAA